jgi:hypothetical protein
MHWCRENNMIVNKYFQKIKIAVFALTIVASATACKKSSDTPAPVVVVPPKPLGTLGLYQLSGGENKRLYIPISQIGTKAVQYFGIFDTGSSGLTMDAHGIIPDEMITATGLQVTGDSVVVNGITITNKKATMSYGDLTSSTKEYGNLAYAPITIGNSAGTVTTKRIAFFMYYKVEDGKGKEISGSQHSFDVFGVGPSTGFTFAAIVSPLNGFTMPANVTSGFKLAKLDNTKFTSTGAFVSDLLTIGLVPDDLNSAGFIMHPLTLGSAGGYSPNIPATVTYGSTSVAAQILFDTGNPAVSIIENSKETTALGRLPAGTVVTITTNRGFVYTYTTTSTGKLTQIQNPNISGDFRTVMSLDFFTDNQFLTDYTGHRIGLKNN